MELPDKDGEGRPRLRFSNVETLECGANAEVDVVEVNKPEFIDFSDLKVEEEVLSDQEQEDERTCVQSGGVAYTGQKLEEIIDDMTPLTADKGVMKKICKRGVGPCPGEADMIVFEYRAYLVGNENPYDSSYARNKPERFLACDRALIPGMMVALQGMRAGEEAWVLIKPEYAYKELGCPPRIPPNATILYDVTLTEIVKAEIVASMANKDPVDGGDRYTMNIAEEVVRHMLKEGNDLFTNSDYRPALKKYKNTLDYLDRIKLQDDEEEQIHNKLYLRALLNTAVVYVKLKEPGNCIRECKKALDRKRKSSKALYLYSKSLLMFKSFDEAEDKVNKAIKISPEDKELRKLLNDIRKERDEFTAEEKKMAQRMFPFSPPQQAASQTDEPVEGPFRVSIREKLRRFAADSESDQFDLNVAPSEVDFLKDLSERLNLIVCPLQQASRGNVNVIIRKRAQP